jgi:hypothetical protein
LQDAGERDQRDLCFGDESFEAGNGRTVGPARNESQAAQTAPAASGPGTKQYRK